MKPERSIRVDFGQRFREIEGGLIWWRSGRGFRNGGWSSMIGGEERIREERAFSQWFFRETAARISSEGKALHGSLGERKL